MLAASYPNVYRGLLSKYPSRRCQDLQRGLS